MAEQALVVDMGRVLTARLLKNDGIEGISHCALGDGDATFTDPENPPAPSADQTTLKNEFVRKRSYRTAFLAEDPAGPYDIGGTLSTLGQPVCLGDGNGDGFDDACVKPGCFLKALLR